MKTGKRPAGPDSSCAAGIRVSELRFIAAEAAALGRIVVSNKGKRRTVFLH